MGVAETGAWRDGRGCLTEAGLAVLAAAPPGQAPPELAGHLAACPRCQQRLLAAGQPRRTRRQPPPPWRILVVLGGLILAALALLVLIRHLS